MRGVVSGIVGSGAVAVVAALSLGMTHAAADPTHSPPAAHAQVTPAAQSGPAPALHTTVGPTQDQPTWLRRLLSLRDPAMEAPRRRS